jgi:hypothetical protein
VPGYQNGGNKFDLTKWDAAYFDRLNRFISEAGKRGIVVELVLFCPFYEDVMWDLSPLKSSNNVNEIGDMPRVEVYTLQHPKLLKVQDALVRKIVAELNPHENLYYEICNEPYFGGVTLEWQAHIAATIKETESSLENKHLIAQTIANGSQKIENPNPDVAIFNFHYAIPPETVALNYGLNRVLADDETGFKGSEDVTYRREGWEFILAGGAIYSNLDYSFTPDHESGDAVANAPGGGSDALRSQLRILHEFLQGFDFVRLRPSPSVIQGGVPAGARAWVLAEEGTAYAIYLSAGDQADLVLELPRGSYTAEWIDTKTGEVSKRESITHQGGKRTVKSPRYSEDTALRIKATGN